MADCASLIDVYTGFEREERKREKKRDALDLEWLAWDKEQEAKELEAGEREAKEREEWRKDPQRKEAERKDAERARRSAQVWEGAWVIAGNQRKKAKRRATEPELVESSGSV